MELGMEGIRQRLDIVYVKLRRIPETFDRYATTAAHPPQHIVPELDRVKSEVALLHGVEKLGSELDQLADAARESLTALLSLDSVSPRRKGEAERLLLELRGSAFEESPFWKMTSTFTETFAYASDPLLRVEGGSLFVPTPRFVKRYADHSTFVRVLFQELQNRCAALRNVMEEVREGALLDEPAGLPMDRVDVLHHSTFEQLVADLLDRDGYRIVRSGGGSGDQGVDVLAVDELGNHLAVQCKHFTGGNGRVGQPVVQHLVGGSHPPRTLPIVVTNGLFVGGAKAWAEDGDRARLIDRQALKRWSEDGEPLSTVLREVASE
ncbi:restriction endonuclease [Streptomyces sp. NPDC050585]|uniref:restriction endonuclease n=1 Tax=Streptomyces sp. NPDC050585 TaxID=3365632 RepID=UPI00378FBFC9